VRCPSADIPSENVVEVLDANWQLGVEVLSFVPKGAGAYHWVATAEAGRRWFITGDDLDTKPWFGPDRETVLLGLNAAYLAAHGLKVTAGLTFVVAPIPTLTGAPTVRLDDRYTIAVLAYLDGDSGHWGEPVSSDERQELLELLAALHKATAPTDTPARSSPAVAGRHHLEGALDQLEQVWAGGPYTEPMREELLRARELVAGWLRQFDEMASRLYASTPPAVITHGEPHPANLIKGAEGLSLIDWDTVAMDRVERDLWMLDDGTGSVVAIYEELTGRAVDPLALIAYRRAWALSDLAIIVTQLRRPHVDDEDTKRSWDSFIRILACEEPRPFDGPIHAF